MGHGSVIGATLLILTLRWVLSRFNGKKTRFFDNAWGADAGTRRWLSSLLALAACLGLIAAVR